MPPNAPCIRCSGVIKLNDAKQLICSGCGQLWTIGPEGCWAAEFEENKEAMKEHLEDIKQFARRLHGNSAE
jgi:hypothetical protein